MSDSNVETGGLNKSLNRSESHYLKLYSNMAYFPNTFIIFYGVHLRDLMRPKSEYEPDQSD